MVVSPHLDDGVLSLGASIAAWARRGVQVELLTVFACDPESAAPAGGWDARGGFGTEGEAARARRLEDGRACAVLGASSSWLPYGSLDYERHGDDAEIRSVLLDRLAGADRVLLPGTPLSHPDHAWLAEAIRPDAVSARVGYYAEQPYTRRHPPAPPAFEAMDVGLRDRFEKWNAIRQYRSQLPLLAMRRSLLRGPHVLALADEVVSWDAATLPQS